MIISMPMVGGRDWNGQMVGFHGPVEIDDGDEKAVAWARAWLGMGATLVEDVKVKEEPKEPVKPAAKAPDKPAPPPPPAKESKEPARQAHPAGKSK